MKYLCLFLLCLISIQCKQNIEHDEHLQSILIQKVQELNYINDSLQKELEYSKANLEVCKSYNFE